MPFFSFFFKEKTVKLYLSSWFWTGKCVVSTPVHIKSEDITKISMESECKYSIKPFEAQHNIFQDTMRHILWWKHIIEHMWYDINHFQSPGKGYKKHIPAFGFLYFKSPAVISYDLFGPRLRWTAFKSPTKRKKSYMTLCQINHDKKLHLDVDP